MEGSNNFQQDFVLNEKNHHPNNYEQNFDPQHEQNYDQNELQYVNQKGQRSNQQPLGGQPQNNDFGDNSNSGDNLVENVDNNSQNQAQEQSQEQSQHEQGEDDQSDQFNQAQDDIEELSQMSDGEDDQKKGHEDQNYSVGQNVNGPPILKIEEEEKEGGPPNQSLREQMRGNGVNLGDSNDGLGEEHIDSDNQMIIVNKGEMIQPRKKKIENEIKNEVFQMDGHMSMKLEVIPGKVNVNNEDSDNNEGKGQKEKQDGKGGKQDGQDKKQEENQDKNLEALIQERLKEHLIQKQNETCVGRSCRKCTGGCKALLYGFGNFLYTIAGATLRFTKSEDL
jgi:hypothetical protein